MAQVPLFLMFLNVMLLMMMDERNAKTQIGYGFSSEKIRMIVFLLNFD